MPDMDKTFRRMAESFAEHDISVERITWLRGIGVDAVEVREYLKENVLFEDEKYLKNLFGEKIGSSLYELLGEDGDGVDCALDELLLLNGWIVEVSYREPDPETVKFEGNRPYSWTPASWVTAKIIYSGSLSTALCKALLWGHRLERHAIAEARRLQADEAQLEKVERKE